MEKVKAGTKFKGVFEVECFRKGKLIWREVCENLFTNEGLDHMLAVALTGKTLIEPFYCVLFESDTTILATHDYHEPGYTETNAKVDGANRPEYEDAISSKQITNSANKAVFTFNAGATVYGAALVGGSNTKGDTTDAATHVLLCASQFGSSRDVVDDDVINLTYTVTAADAG